MSERVAVCEKCHGDVEAGEHEVVAGRDFHERCAPQQEYFLREYISGRRMRTIEAARRLADAVEAHDQTGMRWIDVIAAFRAFREADR